MALSTTVFVLIGTLCVHINISLSDSASDSETQTARSKLGQKWITQKEKHSFKSLSTQQVGDIVLTSDNDKERLKDVFLKPILQERVVDTDGNREVQQHIRYHMRSFGWTVTDDTFSAETPFGNKQFTNIIAVQDPSRPRRLTLACHFDSKYYPSFEFIGATDSAVPCAMLLDLAHTLNSSLWADNSSKLDDVSLQFFFLDGEEAFKQWTEKDSIYGARHLAAKLLDDSVQVDVGVTKVNVKRMDTIDVFILLDLIGAPTPTFRNWFPSTEKSFERLVKIEKQLKQKKALSEKSHSYFSQAFVPGGGIQDDHLPFLRAGVPVLHMISYPFPSVWHTERDNESALDYNSIHDLNKILRVFVCEYLHLSPTKPTPA